MKRFQERACGLTVTIRSSASNCIGIVESIELAGNLYAIGLQMKKHHHPCPSARSIVILVLWMGLTLIGRKNLAAMSPANGGADTHSSVPYRMVSFNDGQVDMELVKAAKAMGYNGVQ